MHRKKTITSCHCCTKINMEDVSIPAFIPRLEQWKPKNVRAGDEEGKKQAKESQILYFGSLQCFQTHATRVKMLLTLLCILVLLLNLKIVTSLGTLFAIQYHTHFFIYLVTQHFTCLLTDWDESKLILSFRSGESRRHPPNICFALFFK